MSPSEIPQLRRPEPHLHLCFAPRGAGLLYALAWVADGADAHGWFVGERDGEYQARFFQLPAYGSPRQTGCYCSVDDDVDGRWLRFEWGRPSRPMHSPVAEALRPGLVALRDTFMRDWLFFRDDPACEHEARALNARELSVRDVNIRASCLDRLHTAAALWRYDSPDADRRVPDRLSRHWPLEHRHEDDAAADAADDGTLDAEPPGTPDPEPPARDTGSSG